MTIARLTAPYTPFLAEAMFTNLTGAESVHLDTWPTYDEALIDQGLIDRMRLARQLVALGRAARAKAKVKTRQPLPKALAVVPPDRLTLSTDCGMKPLARMVAKMKLKALADAAKLVRNELMGVR